MTQRLFALSLAAALAAAAIIPAMAADANPKDVLEARETTMKGFGGALKAMGGAAQGGAIDEAVIEAAKKVHDHAPKIGALFPAGTGMNEFPADSEALAKIWEDPDGFKAAAKKLEDASASLVKAAEAKDAAAFGDAFAATRSACGGCHEVYRKPKQ